MKKLIALFLVLMCICLVGCGNASDKITTTKPVTLSTTENITTTKQEKITMKININGKSFDAELYDNETANAFQNMLPLTLNMEELHGNEKYCYLDDSLPANAQNVRTINEGDIMLFGNDCLVVFYENFSTSYSYTKIGHITNTSGLATAVGAGNVEITFE